MRKTNDRLFREATEFKPGDLTAEEEKLVKENNLSAITYVPLKTLVKQEEARAEYEARQRSRAEIMSRPPNDPEKMRLVQEERYQRLEKGFKDRFDGFGYGMGLFVIAGFTWCITDAHGWPIGIFVFMLMLAVLELGYRLYARAN